MSPLCFVTHISSSTLGMLPSLIKQPLARSGLRHSGVNGARTGFQVLNESFVTVTRKLDPELSEEKAWADRDDLFAWEPVG